MEILYQCKAYIRPYRPLVGTSNLGSWNGFGNNVEFTRCHLHHPQDQFSDRPQMSKELSMKHEDPGAKIGFWLLPLNQQNQQQMV